MRLCFPLEACFKRPILGFAPPSSQESNTHTRSSGVMRPCRASSEHDKWVKVVRALQPAQKTARRLNPEVTRPHLRPVLSLSLRLNLQIPQFRHVC